MQCLQCAVTFIRNCSMMGYMKTIIGISGSLRSNSWNTLVLESMQSMFPDGYQLVVYPLNDIPLYDADTEAEIPAAVTEFKSAIESADAVIIATPEYNRSIPGVLKNAIDWATRPYGSNSWANKPLGIIGASTGVLGTAVAQAHLRQIMTYSNMRIMGAPEVYLASIASKFDALGNLIDQPTIDRLQKLVDNFVLHIAK